MKSDGSGSPIGPRKKILEATADGIKILFLIFWESDKISLRRKEIQGGDRCLEGKNLEAYLRDVVDGRHCSQNRFESGEDRLDDGLLERVIR